MNCPRCKEALSIEIYEGVEIDRCKKCSGTWLDSGELQKIVSTKEKTFTPQLIQETLATTYSGVPKDEQRAFVECPKCLIAMKPVNYVYDSGIIIDSCAQCSGTWLDGSELERVQVYREQIEKDEPRYKEQWLQLANAVEEKRQSAKDEVRKREMAPPRYLINSIIRKLIG